MEWRSYGSAFEVVLGRGDARKIRGETPVPCDAGAWKGIRVRDGLMALAPGPSGCTVDVEMRVLRLCAGGARAVLDSIDAGEMAVVCTAFTEQMRTVLWRGARRARQQRRYAAATRERKVVANSRWGPGGLFGERERDGAVYSKQIRKSERNLTKHLRTTARPCARTYTHKYRHRDGGSAQEHHGA